MIKLVVEKTGVIVSTDLEATIKETNPDVMVDFTQPSVVFNTASIAIKKSCSSCNWYNWTH